MNFSEWLKKDDSKPSAPRKMQKISRKEVKTSGNRLSTDDLSKDYKGHIAANGEVEPFKVAKECTKPEEKKPEEKPAKEKPLHYADKETNAAERWRVWRKNRGR